MSFIIGHTNIGLVIQIEGLLKEMKSIEEQFKDVEGEMHYSKSWEMLKAVLNQELEAERKWN